MSLFNLEHLRVNKNSIYQVSLRTNQVILTSKEEKGAEMFTFLLWVVLLILCWPIALLALIIYPFLWLLSIPFRVLGFAVEGLLSFIKALFLFPSRVLGRAK